MVLVLLTVWAAPIVIGTVLFWRWWPDQSEKILGRIPTDFPGIAFQVGVPVIQFLLTAAGWTFAVGAIAG